MFKLSKYNYHTRNDSGDLLLFNSFTGSKSFLKVKKENAINVRKFLIGKETSQALPDGLKDSFVELGYLVPEQENELEKLKGLYLDVIGDNTLSLTILPTIQCNFRCKYCYETFQNKYMDESIQQGIVKYIRKHINKFSGVHIAWFGGEPLEGFDVIENLSQQVIEICKRNKKPYFASITTNGYGLTEETFRKLLKYKVLHYQITIDGIRDVHDFQRPHVSNSESTFDVITGNLKAIKNYVKSRTFNIMVRTNFSKELIEKIDEYKNFFVENFSNDKRFTFFARPVMDWGGEAIKSFCSSIYGEKEMIADIYKKICESNGQLTYTYEGFLDPGGGVCYAAKKNSYVITPTGGIYKCTCDFETKREARIGHVTENGEFSLDKYKENSWICTPESCNNLKNCFFSPNCLGEGCPATRILNRGEGNNCPLEKITLRDTLKLLDHQNNSFKKVF